MVCAHPLPPHSSLCLVPWVGAYVGGERVKASFPSKGPMTWWCPLCILGVASVQSQLSWGTSVVLPGSPGASPCTDPSLEDPLQVSLLPSPIYLSEVAPWEDSRRKTPV